MALLSVYKQLHGEEGSYGSYDIAVALDEFARSDDGTVPLLTADCATATEWDSQIDQLIQQLEVLRIRGKEFLT